VFSVQTEGTGAIGAAAYPYAYIETTDKRDPPRPPRETDGARALPEDSIWRTGTGDIIERDAAAASRERCCLALEAAVLDAGDVPAGETGVAGSVTVENGYAEDVYVEIKPIPGLRGLARDILLTPGHTWTEDEGWLQPRGQGKLLLAGKRAHFEVVVASPLSSSTYNYRWEGLLEVSGPKGPEAVVRVRWRTTPPALVRAPGTED
jgi:hypothetical protein